MQGAIEQALLWLENKRLQIDRMLATMEGQVRALTQQQAQQFAFATGNNQITYVHYDTACGVNIPSQLTVGVATVSVLAVYSAEISIDWDGEKWTGCGVIHYPGPYHWEVVGENPDHTPIWQIVGYLDGYACDTPVTITLTPPDADGPYKLTIGQLIADDPVSIIWETFNNAGTVRVHQNVDTWVSESGTCSGSPNSSVDRFVVPQCGPWRVVVDAFDGNLAIDNGRPLFVNGQEYNALISVP